MAVKFDVASSRVDIHSFAPEVITIKPELNGRHDLPDIQWLIADILSLQSDGKTIKGQLEPGLVYNDGGKPVLAAGYSRWRAISEINRLQLAPVPMKYLAKVLNGVTAADAFIMGISENRFRNQTTELDDAHNIKQLRSFGMGDEEIGLIYFPTVSSSQAMKEAIRWVSKRESLLQLTPEAEQALKEGRIKPTAATAFAKLSQEAQRKAVAGEGKITPKAISEAAGKPKPVNKARLMEEALEQADALTGAIGEWEKDLTDGVIPPAILSALNSYNKARHAVQQSGGVGFP